MKLLDKIKEVLVKKEPVMIRVRGEISGANWAEINMTNIKGKPITLGTPIADLNIRMQTLTFGAIFSPQDRRIDNAHGFLHQHSRATIFPLGDKTMSCALLALFGKEYEVLENQGL